MNIIGPGWIIAGREAKQYNKWSDVAPGDWRTTNHQQLDTKSLLFSPLLVGVVRLAPHVVDLGDPGDGPEPLAGLPLQLLSIV